MNNNSVWKILLNYNTKEAKNFYETADNPIHSSHVNTCIHEGKNITARNLPHSSQVNTCIQNPNT